MCENGNCVALGFVFQQFVFDRDRSVDQVEVIIIISHECLCAFGCKIFHCATFPAWKRADVDLVDEILQDTQHQIRVFSLMEECA